MSVGATRPTVPTGAYIEHMRAETQERSTVLSAPPALEAGEGAPSEWRERLGGLLENLRSELLELSHDIHDHPETGWNEHHAMAAVGALLDRHGIAHDDGVFGLETALRAEIGATADGDQIPNFEMLATAYGMAARTVRSADEVDEAIEWAMGINDRPVLIDFRVSPDAMVWPMVAAGVSNDEIRYAKGMAPNWEVED